MAWGNSERKWEDEGCRGEFEEEYGESVSARICIGFADQCILLAGIYDSALITPFDVRYLGKAGNRGQSTRCRQVS